MERRFHELEASDADVEITVTGGIHRPPFVRGPQVEALFAKTAADPSEAVRALRMALTG